MTSHDSQQRASFPLSPLPSITPTLHPLFSPVEVCIIAFFFLPVSSSLGSDNGAPRNESIEKYVVVSWCIWVTEEDVCWCLWWWWCEMCLVIRCLLCRGRGRQDDSICPQCDASAAMGTWEKRLKGWDWVRAKCGLGRSDAPRNWFRAWPDSGH